MQLIVEKFGGSSVGTIDRINCVADHLIARQKNGEQLVVVVSAMSGETNRLIELAKQVNNKPSPRESDVLLSTGEQVTISLLSMALHERGCHARSYTGGQVSIRTNNAFSKARIIEVDIERIREDLSLERIVVVAGFQGIDNDGNITTLGRGGSDTTAVAIAAALDADECRIYTDVEGVFTTDPRVVLNARRLDNVAYDEMLEMSSQGAKVLHSRSVELASKFNVPLQVLSSFGPGRGTCINDHKKESVMESAVISGIAFERDEAKLSVLGIPNTLSAVAEILGSMSDANINVDIIIQNTGSFGLTDLSFTISNEDYQACIDVLSSATNKFSAVRIEGDERIAKISIVGVGVRSHCSIAKLLLDTLAGQSIRVKMISTSEIKISVVIDERDLELAVNSLHDAFNLSVCVSQLAPQTAMKIAHFQS